MNVEVTMLPVNAGDATLLVWSDGRSRHSVLVDAGLREKEAVSYIQSIGIFHLDLIILSHPDIDHLGGLLAIIRSRAMSVDRIWCFDLNFLREFIRTGQIPPPRPATREVIYAYLLRSTLDQFSDILTSANGRGVQVLQVSEGYRLSLGGVLLEVLYPPQSFYDALSSPIALKRMLVDRKWPEDWAGEREGQEGESGQARPLSRREREERLTEMVEKPELPEEGYLLSHLEEPGGEPPDSEQEDEFLPWRMVGTLYNNLSIVIKVTVLGGMNPSSILFPGDLTDWTTLVLRHWNNLKADVLKMPHHGSRRIGCDRRAVSDVMEHFILWHFFCERRSLSLCPVHRPFLRRDWHRLERLIDIGDPVRLLGELVGPSKILVFPHPQHGLPSIPFTGFHSILVANRRDRDPRALSLKSNEACAAQVLVGLERGDVREVEI